MRVRVQTFCDFGQLSSHTAQSAGMPKRVTSQKARPENLL